MDNKSNDRLNKDLRRRGGIEKEDKFGRKNKALKDDSLQQPQKPFNLSAISSKKAS